MDEIKTIPKKTIKEKYNELKEKYKKSKFYKKFEKIISPYLFILPYMIFFITFTLTPASHILVVKVWRRV